MSTPVLNIIAKLKEANATAEFDAVKAKLAEGVEANRAAGPGTARLMQQDVLHNVYLHIGQLNPAVAKTIKYEPCKFYVREPSKDNYSNEWRQASGWTHAGFECKYAYLSINFDVERGAYSYRTGSRTGKNYLTFGSYGDRKRFKQLKTGSWNYKGIAEEIIVRVIAGMRRQEQQDRLTANKTAVQQVRDACTMVEYPHYVTVTNTADPEKPVNVRISYGRNCTVAQAIELVKALEAIGIKN
jgi:hypothetical protein